MIIASLTNAVGVLPVFLTGALAVQMRDSIGLQTSQLGLAASMFYCSSAVTSPMVGRAVQRLGSRAGLLAALSFSASSAFLIAVAARSPALLILFLALGGIGNATSNAATTLLIAESVPANRHGIAFGIRQAAVPAATLIGGLAIPTIALTVGWRWAFAASAALATSVFLTVASQQAITRKTDKIRDRASGSATPTLLFLAATIGFGAASVNALGAFFVDSVVRTGITPSLAGGLLAGGSIVGFIVRIGGGWLADRHPRGRLLTVALMLLAGAVGLVLLALESKVAVFPAVVLAFGAGWGWPGLFALAVVSHNAQAPAAATGITQTGGYVGGAAGPLLFGAVASGFTYAVAWMGAAAFALLGAAAAIVALLSIRKRSLEPDLDGQPLVATTGGL